jgi:P27 family predicted phage terminase small subunit
MPAGRPPQPLEVKRLRGRTPSTDSGGRKLPSAAKFTTRAGIPDPPAGLGRTGAELWRTLWGAGPWLGQPDMLTVRMLVENLVERDQMRELIARDGMLLPCQGRTRTVHPLVKALRQLEEQIAGAAGRLGFDPAARSKLGIALTSEPSRLTEMMELAQRREPKSS